MSELRKQLQRMFDFQRFAGNPRLSRRIAEMEMRLGLQEEGFLSDDALEQVWAAGDLDARKAEEKRDGN